jgi:hypothetical protein
MVERTIDPAEVTRERGLRTPDVHESRRMLIVIAAWIGACDMIVKLVEPTETGLYHKRTHLELFVILAISATAVYLVPLARSRLISLGAGLMVGGGIGNALSILVFPLGVPNPFTVSESGWTIAFNLADVCVAIGFVLMTSGVWGLSIGRRHELRSPVER